MNVGHMLGARRPHEISTGSVLGKEKEKVQVWKVSEGYKKLFLCFSSVCLYTDYVSATRWHAVPNQDIRWHAIPNQDVRLCIGSLLSSVALRIEG